MGNRTEAAGFQEVVRQFFSDFRYGARLLMKSPGLAATAVLALALGIGANTAIFSVVYNVLLRPLPVREPGKLFVFTHSNAERKLSLTQTPYPDVAEWRRTLRSVEAVAGVSGASMSLSSGQEPERVYVSRVTESFFPMLGTGPVIGRNFLPEEDRPGGNRSAILSYKTWENRFASNPDAVGSQVKLDGDSYTVIGVLPEGFRFTGRAVDVFVPLQANQTRGAGRPAVVTAYGRLKPGVREAQLQAELDVATAATQAREPRYKSWRLTAGPLSEWIVPDVRQSLWVLLGAVGLVLLIACANVASLLLSRAAARRREIAVRAALGAGRKRLVSQLVAESLPLGVAGGTLGLFIAWWCVRAIPLLDAGRVPRIEETAIDATVLAFTAGVSLLTCALFGLLPALALSRADVHEALKEGGRSSSTGLRGRRLRSALVIAEVAIALVLAIGATLTIRTFHNVSTVDPGFRPVNVLTASVELPREKLKSREEVVAFYGSVMQRVRSLPGVKAAGVTNSLPLGGNYFRGDWAVQGREYAKPGDVPVLGVRIADAEYADALGIPLRRGRFFNASDTTGSEPVVVVNESAARRLFPGENPVGQRIGDPKEWRTVVGVVADIKNEDVTSDAAAEVIVPFSQVPAASITFAVRLDQGLYPDPMRFAPLLRRAVAEVNSGLAVFQPASFEQVMNRRLSMRRLSMILLVAFAILALTLAAVGIYGVLAFSVEQRTQEIGVRMALGASAADVVGSVVREAMMLAAIGVAGGIAASLALTRFAQSILFGVKATDPAVFVGIAVLLSMVAIAAAYVPARRATRVDPLVALRCD